MAYGIIILICSELVGWFLYGRVHCFILVYTYAFLGDITVFV